MAGSEPTDQNQQNRPSRGVDPARARRIFQNLTDTPQFGEGYNIFDVLKTLFNKPKSIAPAGTVPSIRSDLKHYYSADVSVFWFGHSSYLIHANGKNILIDPVFSGYASPFSFQIKAFPGADVYKPSDMPEINCLILTHNHYDHLDYSTLKVLAAKTTKFVMPLCVSRDLRSLKIAPERIIELGWWQGADVAEDIKITAAPARHFSGRSFKRNRSLWASYALSIGQQKIFIGGDSGYDAHFAEIGNKLGPFDLALLECGQYNVMWPYIHSLPEDLIAEGKELQAKVVMPVHWGKFALATHEWNEPVRRFTEAAEKNGVAYTVPMIGEAVVIGKHYPKNDWWRKLP